MLQFPAFMRQFPAPPLIPSSVLLPLWPTAQTDDTLIDMLENEMEEVKLREIRKENSDLVVVGKASFDFKGDLDADADEDDADNAEESDGDDFEQETA